MTTIKLSSLKNGQSAVILQISVPATEADRLSAMGFFVGQRLLKKCSQPLNGPISLQLNGSNVAISSRLASHIMVQADV